MNKKVQRLVPKNTEADAETALEIRTRLGIGEKKCREILRFYREQGRLRVGFVNKLKIDGYYNKTPVYWIEEEK